MLLFGGCLKRGKGFARMFYRVLVMAELRLMGLNLVNHVLECKTWSLGLACRKVVSGWGPARTLV